MNVTKLIKVFLIQIKILFKLFLHEEIKGEKSDVNTPDQSLKSFLLRIFHYLFKVMKPEKSNYKRNRNDLIDKEVIWSNYWLTHIRLLTKFCIAIKKLIIVVKLLCFLICKFDVIACLVCLIKLAFLLCVLIILLIILIYLWRFLCQIF